MTKGAERISGLAISFSSPSYSSSWFSKIQFFELPVRLTWPSFNCIDWIELEFDFFLKALYDQILKKYLDDECVLINALNNDSASQLNNCILLIEFVNANCWTARVLVHVLSTRFPSCIDNRLYLKSLKWNIKSKWILRSIYNYKRNWKCIDLPQVRHSSTAKTINKKVKER